MDLGSLNSGAKVPQRSGELRGRNEQDGLEHLSSLSKFGIPDPPNMVHFCTQKPILMLCTSEIRHILPSPSGFDAASRSIPKLREGPEEHLEDGESVFQ